MRWPWLTSGCAGSTHVPSARPAGDHGGRRLFGAAIPVPSAAAVVTDQRPGEAGGSVLQAEADAEDERAGLHLALEAREQPIVGGDHGEQNLKPRHGERDGG